MLDLLVSQHASVVALELALIGLAGYCFFAGFYLLALLSLAVD